MSVGIVLPAYTPDRSTLRSYVIRLVNVLDPDRIRVELDAPDGRSISFPDYDTVEVNTEQERRGKGLAITQGFDSLETDVLTFADADGSTPAESIADVVTALNNADVSVGSRRHPEATVKSHQSVFRRSLGDVFALISRVFLPVHLYDYQCGAKALTRKAWEDIRPHLTKTGFAWDIEFIVSAAALGYDIAEVPVKWRDDPRSTVDTFETTIELARTALEARRRYASIQSGSDTMTRRRLIER